MGLTVNRFVWSILLALIYVHRDLHALNIDSILTGPTWAATYFNVSHLDSHVTGDILLEYISHSDMTIQWMDEKKYHAESDADRPGYTLAFRVPVQNFPIYTTENATTDISDSALSHRGTLALTWSTRWQYPRDVYLQCDKPDGSLTYSQKVNLVSGIIPTWGYDRLHLNLISVITSFPPKLEYTVGQQSPIQATFEVFIPNYLQFNSVHVKCWRYRFDRRGGAIIANTYENGVYTSGNSEVIIIKSPAGDAGLFVKVQMSVFASSDEDEFIHSCRLTHQRSDITTTTDVLKTTSNTTLPAGFDKIDMWVHAYDTREGDRYNIIVGKPTAITCKWISAIEGEIQILRDDGVAVHFNPEDIKGFERAGMYHWQASYIIPSMGFMHGATYTCGSSNGPAQSSVTLNPVVLQSGW